MASMTWEDFLATLDNPSADITTIAAVARLFTAAHPDGVGLSSPAQAAGLQKTMWRGFQWPHWLARDTDSLQIKGLAIRALLLISARSAACAVASAPLLPNALPEMAVDVEMPAMPSLEAQNRVALFEDGDPRLRRQGASSVAWAPPDRIWVVDDPLPRNLGGSGIDCWWDPRAGEWIRERRSFSMDLRTGDWIQDPPGTGCSSSSSSSDPSEGLASLATGEDVDGESRSGH